jgi:hypothetical protein
MTFTDQWANRHDGECEVESYVKSYGGLRPIYVDCHCYRRWLEARLGEITESLQEMVEAHDDECHAGKNCHSAFVVNARAYLLPFLPPKGAGE